MPVWNRGRLLLSLAVLVTAAPLAAQSPSSHSVAPRWPRRVLVTNDNGIDDRATRALALALGKVADTYLVASVDDQSGASNRLTFTRTGEFRVERRDIGPGVHAWAIHGTPADAVIFALSGPMHSAPPDLVISGINGGANLADEWFGSGTIGAVRTGAYLGIPGIAVSGVDDDDSVAVNAAVQWVLKLVESALARDLRAPQYLTVSLPEIPPDSIQGPVIVKRARGLVSAKATPPARTDGDSLEVWKVRLERHPERALAGTDVAAVAANHIAIVPMRAGEYDDAFRADSLPPWR